ncbi:hypothetical protein ACIRD6_36960 [Streptomyces sp. NPDC102473]|uniref:hypothetical protein n=1 Tax=Streptomyces sp. NPDC102473 TaxID=3366180 RepID=UPI00380FD60A
MAGRWMDLGMFMLTAVNTQVVLPYLRGEAKPWAARANHNDSSRSNREKHNFLPAVNTQPTNVCTWPPADMLPDRSAQIRRVAPAGRRQADASIRALLLAPKAVGCPEVPEDARSLQRLRHNLDMGIDLQLHDGRPYWPSRRSKRRATLIRQSHELGEALAQLVAKLPRNTSGKLWTVDPYNDTIFNEQEAEAALREIPDLLQCYTEDPEAEAIRILAAYLEACVATPGSYVVFLGD